MLSMKPSSAIVLLTLAFYLLSSFCAVFYIWRNTHTQLHKPGYAHKLSYPIKEITIRNLSLRPASMETPLVFDETELERRYWNQWSPLNLSYHQHHQNKLSPKTNRKKPAHKAQYVIDIWSNNGLGEYLWEHILQGELRVRPDQLYRYGEKTINNVKYRYKGGSSLDVAFLPDGTENVILVLNARDNLTTLTAKLWLEGLSDFEMLQNAGLILIGDETCRNDWLLSYLHHKNATSPKFVFLVYDSPMVDGKTVLQFPLGVATNFPLPAYPDLVTTGSRKYICNFLGTVYRNSSRERLMRTIEKLNTARSPPLCYTRARYEWLAEEPPDSLSSYVDVLRSSDLTLCPVGMNAESYRIYEALSVGSVPVIEDRSVSRSCAPLPHRLLKQYKAPVIFISDWSQLVEIVRQEQSMTLEAKEKRRELVLSWYKYFRKTLAQQFTSIVERTFVLP